jgi:hypothetical protein
VLVVVRGIRLVEFAKLNLQVRVELLIKYHFYTQSRPKLCDNIY